MYRFTALIAILFILLADTINSTCQVAFVCRGQFFATHSAQLNSESTLIEVVMNPVTQVIEFQTIDALGVNVNAIGYRPTDHLIYGIDPDLFHLYQIDATGNATLLKTLENIPPDVSSYAGDVSSDGRFLTLIALDRGSFGEDKFVILVDLEDPAYPVTVNPVSGPATLTFDIAYDPITGDLYGFDSSVSRLIRIDPETGVISTPFGTTTLTNSVGGLFFDAFGSLFAYGTNAANPTSNGFFRINKYTGSLSFIADAPRAQGNDACSCPYTIEIQKSVEPRVVLPCTDVVYYFEISNQSGNAHSEIDFLDVFPEEFVIRDIVKNPFGGTIVQGIGDHVLTVQNMHVPGGSDTLIVQVEIGENARGYYANQAMLMNLLPSLGELAISDDPGTFIREDSTTLFVDSLSLDFIQDSMDLCPGDTLLIDATIPGGSYIWDNGYEEAVLTVSEQGTYYVTVSTGCSSAEKTVSVQERGIGVTFNPPLLNIDLGDSILLQPLVLNLYGETDYKWTSEDLGSLKCLDCPNPIAFPVRNVAYDLQVSNAFDCIAQASLEVYVDNSRKVYFPNIFSPNGDGVNDRFTISGQAIAEIEIFQVFSRWGAVVYEKNQVGPHSINWDGQYEGDFLDPGVFVWMAKVRFVDQKVEIFTGDVTLVR